MSVWRRRVRYRFTVGLNCFTQLLLGTSGQMVLRETATPTNILYAVAWGTVTSYVAGMTDAATWSGDGMISLSPSGTTYTRTDYNASNSQYSHTLSASITNIPNSSGEPLPVELTSFTAKATGSVVTLNWETATEVDNYPPAAVPRRQLRVAAADRRIRERDRLRRAAQELGLMRGQLESLPAVGALDDF